ncbi:hypothetical protein L227DRAFT_186032 [Lentinus tigrinus ALCF2SS1-6]|uniref:Uncharacterized protein n=1 Tax=Lentinus tigrinus ALCF2SS1-6 TaxID=1328759 RepID=A0A5C2S4A5_9APHY|nr:hypothetical protein L227DRAFT_186032 [Lentinus tigrinus ALCF2SS1-6]
MLCVTSFGCIDCLRAEPEGRRPFRLCFIFPSRLSAFFPAFWKVAVVSETGPVVSDPIIEQGYVVFHVRRREWERMFVPFRRCYCGSCA